MEEQLKYTQLGAVLLMKQLETEKAKIKVLEQQLWHSSHANAPIASTPYVRKDWKPSVSFGSEYKEEASVTSKVAPAITPQRPLSPSSLMSWPSLSSSVERSRRPQEKEKEIETAWKAKCASLETALEDMQQRFSEREAEWGLKKAALREESETKLVELEKQLDEEHEEECKKISENIKEHLGKVHEEEKKEWKLQLEQMQKQHMDEWSQKVQGLITEREMALEKVERRWKRKCEELEAIDVEKKDRDRVLEMEGKMMELKEEAEAKLQHAGDRVAKAADQLGEMEEKNEELEKEIEELEKEKKAVETKLQHAGDRVAKAADQLGEMEEKMEKKIAELEKEKEAGEQEKAQFQKQNKKLRELLDKALREKAGDNVRSEELEKMEKDIVELRKEKEVVETKLQHAGDRVAKAADQLNALQQENEELRDVVAATKADALIAQERSIVSRDIQVQDRVDAQLEEAATRVQDLTEEVRMLHTALQQCEQWLHEEKFAHLKTEKEAKVLARHARALLHRESQTRKEAMALRSSVSSSDSSVERMQRAEEERDALLLELKDVRKRLQMSPQPSPVLWDTPESKPVVWDDEEDGPRQHLPKAISPPRKPIRNKIET